MSADLPSLKATRYSLLGLLTMRVAWDMAGLGESSEEIAVYDKAVKALCLYISSETDEQRRDIVEIVQTAMREAQVLIDKKKQGARV